MTDRIFIFDTTLRDGEQAPGATLKVREKLIIAQKLESLGVDTIEAGFPASSEDEFEAVKKISEKITGTTVAALARAKIEDIDRCIKSLGKREDKKIHTFISTSPLHIKHKLRMNENDVLEAVKSSVSYARNSCENIEWSAEDATRSDFDFLCKCIELAIKQGASTITIADTVGFTVPEEISKLVKKLRNNVTNIDKAIFSVHCHDDLGLSVANSLSAIQAGARQVHCTVNGIGERAGNASLEEITMAINIRNDIYKYTNNINTKLINLVSKIVEKYTGFLVPNNKAIVGKNAFTHESGIHQHGVIINSSTYEIIDPKLVGILSSSLVIGKHSGKHALKKKVEELGYDIKMINFDILLKRIKEIANKKKKISNEEIISIVNELNVSYGS